jgi:hypothetical protein
VRAQGSSRRDDLARDHSWNWEVYDEYLKKNFPDRDEDGSIRKKEEPDAK